MGAETIHECVSTTILAELLHSSIADVTPRARRVTINHVLTIILLFTQTGAQPTLFTHSLLPC